MVILMKYAQCLALQKPAVEVVVAMLNQLLAVEVVVAMLNQLLHQKQVHVHQVVLPAVPQ